MGNESAGSAAFDRAPDSEIDLPGVWRAIVRKKTLIAAITLMSFLGALAFVMLIKPRFTGEAKLLVENQESYFTRPDKAASDQQTAPDSEAVASQVQLLTSREIAREAIKQLNLKGNAEFDPLAGGEGALARIANLLGLASSNSHLSAEDRIFEAYGDRLTVFALPKSRVISLEFRSQDRELAARGANTIADIYVEMQARAKRERASLAAKSLAAIVNELRTKLAEAEGKVEAFRSNSGLLQGSTTATISNQQLGELSAQLAAARNTMADAQAKARLIRGILQRGRLDEVSDVARDDLVRKLGEQRATLRGRLALEARTLGPSHPRILELNAQLASAETELRAAAERSARGLENDARIANTRVENIMAAMEADKKRVGGSGNDQAQLRELELEAKLIREQLEGNTNKYREALARQQSLSTPSDARIISSAVVPDRPSFPKRLPILLFAAIGGFILSLAGVIAAELLSGRALRPVQAALPTAVSSTAVMAGVAPAIESPESAPPPLDPAMLRLARRMLASDTRDYGMRVLVCACAPEIDVGFGIEPLARALSAQRKVVMIDFGGRVLENETGLSELIAGKANFADVIERDEGSRLHLIGRGTGVASVGSELDVIIDVLSQTYEFIFILAPQPDEDDAFVTQMAPAADKAIILAKAGGDRQAAQSLQNNLSLSGASEISVLTVSTDPIPANDVVSPRRAA